MTGGSTSTCVRVRPLPPGRRAGAHAAGRRRRRRSGACPSADCRTENGDGRRGRPARALRRAGGGRGEAAAARPRSRSRRRRRGRSSASRRKRLDSPGEDHGPRAVRHGRPVPRAAHRGGRALAGTSAARVQALRRRRGARRCRGVKAVVQVPTRRRGGGRALLGGEAGPRRARGRVGSGRGRRDRQRRAARAVPRAGGARRACAAKAGGRSAAPRWRRPRSVVEAEYDVPYLAHAPMEPLNCTVRIGDGQVRDLDRHAVPDRWTSRWRREITGLKPEQVEIHTHVPRRRLRPARHADLRLRARGRARGEGGGRAGQDGLDARGRHARRLLPAAVRPHGRRSASTRRARRWPGSTCSSASRSWPARRSRAWSRTASTRRRSRASPTRRTSPTSRTTASSCTRRRLPRPDAVVALGRPQHTAFVMETLIDELARAAGQDPLDYRRALLARAPAPPRRARTSPRRRPAGARRCPPGRVRGLAVHESFGSFVAQVAEVSVDGGRIRVHRVVCADRLRHRRQPGGRRRADASRGVVFGLSRRAARRDHAAATGACSSRTSTTTACCA